MNLILLGILLYVVLQLVVGVLVSRQIKSEADYLVAGRKIGLGLAMFSMFATWFGAETCVGAAGKFYAEGFAGGVSDPFGYTLVLLLVGWFIARLRKQRQDAAPVPVGRPSGGLIASVPTLAHLPNPASASKFGAHDPRLLDEVMRSTPDMKALAKLAPRGKP